MAKETASPKSSPRRNRPSQKPPKAVMASDAVTVTHEDIARRAFEIYVARGASDGDALGDWVQAERELQGHAIPQPF